MRTHTGEKPYKCTYCERAYAESGDLTKHLRTHVGENTYMCSECPMAFKYQSELRQHVSDHYKMSQQLLQQTQKMSNDEPVQHQVENHQAQDQQELLHQHHHHQLELHVHQQTPPVNIPITNTNPHTSPPHNTMNLVGDC